MIKLLPNRLGIEPIFDPDKIGHIYIPEVAKERCDQGLIKYIGPNCQYDWEIGDHLIFSGYTGQTIRIDDEIIIVMHEDFVKAKILTDDYMVPGIYHKGKVDSRKLVEEFANIAYGSTTVVTDLMRLFAKYSNDLLIPASYEHSARLMADAYKREFGERVDVKAGRQVGPREWHWEKDEVEYDERSR